MNKLLKNTAAAPVRGLARIAVWFGGIFRHGASSENPAGRGTVNAARPRRRLVDGVDADRFTRLCVVMVVGFATLIGAILVSAALQSGSRQIALDDLPADDTPDGLTLTLGGEIMPTQDMTDCAAGDSGYNYHHYLSELSGALSGDLTVAGLCGQIDAYGKDRRVDSLGGFDTGMNYPDALAEAIADAGIHYVMGANPYAFANGYNGMCQSIANLHAHSVGVVGLTRNDPRRLNSGVIRRGGVCLGLAGYNCRELATGDNLPALTAEQKTYIAQCDPDADELAERAASDIAKMRASGAEFFVICVNWGSAGSLEPSDFMRDAAKKLAQAGADVVVGFGARVPMQVEIIKGAAEKDCYVFYSLGVICGDNSYSSKTLTTLGKSKSLTDEQKKKLSAEKKKASAANAAMSRSMTVSLKLVRAKNGSIEVESGRYFPLFLLKNTSSGEENAPMKYMVLEAARYAAAEERPTLFADDAQWQRCRETVTAISALTETAGGKLLLAGADGTDGENDAKI